MKRILLASAQKSHSLMFGPIVRFLKKKAPNITIDFVALDLWHALDAAGPLIEFELPYHQLAKPVEGPNLRAVKSKLHRLALLHAARSEVQACLERFLPDLVVLGADHAGIENLFVQYASSMRIPTLLVQDGALADHTTVENAMNYLGSYAYGCGGSTYKAVTGEFDRRLMMHRGVYPEQVTITGQPRYDLLFQERKNSIAPEIPSWVSEPIFLFATQPAFEYRDWGNREPVREVDLAALVITACQPHLYERTLVVKLHPRESLETYLSLPEFSKAQESNVWFTRDADLQTLLERSDLVIVPGSSVAQEAIILDKPVIALSFAVPGGKSYLTDNPAVFDVTAPHQLSEALQLVLNDTVVRERLSEGRFGFVTERLHRADGNASERVARLILDLLEDSRLVDWASRSHAIAALCVENALEAFESDKPDLALERLKKALVLDPRLEEDQMLITGELLSRTYLIGKGLYSAPAAQQFIHIAGQALRKSDQKVLRAIAKQFVGESSWAAAREVKRCKRLYALRQLATAAINKPMFMCNRGFLRCALDSLLPGTSTSGTTCS